MCIFLLVTWAFITALFWFVMLVMGGKLHSQGKLLLLCWKCHNKWPDKNAKTS